MRVRGVDQSSDQGPDHITESELIEEARDGDTSAFADLIRTHQATALRVAFVVTSSAADAEDVVQEAFVKAWRALGHFRSGSEFRPWLLKIVSNEAKNKVRARGRRQMRDHRFAIPEMIETGPETATIEEETRHRVWEAVTRLGEEERRTVICRYLLELSERETAELLGIPPGTVKSRLDRARRSLASLLETERTQS